MSQNPRTMPLNPDWIEWWRNGLRVLTEGGVMAFPLRGVAYKLDRTAKTLTVIVEHPHFNREGDVAVLSERCVSVLGYTVVYLDEPARTLEAMMEGIKNGNYIISGEVLEQLTEFFRRNPLDPNKWPKRRRSWDGN